MPNVTAHPAIFFGSVSEFFMRWRYGDEKLRDPTIGWMCAILSPATLWSDNTGRSTSVCPIDFSTPKLCFSFPQIYVWWFSALHFLSLHARPVSGYFACSRFPHKECQQNSMIFPGSKDKFPGWSLFFLLLPAGLYRNTTKVKIFFSSWTNRQGFLLLNAKSNARRDVLIFSSHRGKIGKFSAAQPNSRFSRCSNVCCFSMTWGKEKQSFSQLTVRWIILHIWLCGTGPCHRTTFAA